MQSFRLLRTLRSGIFVAHASLSPRCENMMSSAKPEVYNIKNAFRGIVHKIGEVRSCGLWDMRADRQIERETDMFITIIRTPIPGEVTKTRFP